AGGKDAEAQGAAAVGQRGPLVGADVDDPARVGGVVDVRAVDVGLGRVALDGHDQVDAGADEGADADGRSADVERLGGRGDDGQAPDVLGRGGAVGVPLRHRDRGEALVGPGVDG